jgi:hypothetical protein
MTVGALVAVGDFPVNVVGKSFGFSRHLQLIAGHFCGVPRHYALMDDQIGNLVKPYLACLAERRNRFLLRDEFREMQLDQATRLIFAGIV